jgi:hypothetical protein
VSVSGGFVKKLFAGLMLVAAVLSSCAPSAQSNNPSPQALFEKAKAAHGGAALDALKTYRESGIVELYQGGQLSTRAAYVQKYDLVAGTVRIEIALNGKLTLIQQASKVKAWQWTTQSGAVLLDAVTAQFLREGLNQWPFSLRAKSADLREATYDGRVELKKGMSGDSISFKLNGSLNNFVIADSGVVLGTKTVQSDILVVNEFNDLRVVSGIKLPFQIKINNDGVQVVNLQTATAQINPLFTAADFAQPK